MAFSNSFQFRAQDTRQAKFLVDTIGQCLDELTEVEKGEHDCIKQYVLYTDIFQWHFIVDSAIQQNILCS